MDKKDNELLKKWERHTAFIRLDALIEAERKDTCKGCDNAAYCSHYRNGTVVPLPAPYGCKASFVSKHESFGGYLVAVFVLLKQAFFHKNRKHIILVGY